MTVFRIVLDIETKEILSDLAYHFYGIISKRYPDIIVRDVYQVPDNDLLSLAAELEFTKKQIAALKKSLASPSPTTEVVG